MTDYDLTVVAVVDEQERLLGVITVDDVLELRAAEGLAPALRRLRRGLSRRQSLRDDRRLL